MPDEDTVRRALRSLAGPVREPEPDLDRETPATEYREIIERASEAVEDVAAAAAFVENHGVDELAAAVERAERDLSGCAEDGREALAAFRAFRDAAGDQFRSGHGTSLGGDSEPDGT